MGQKVYKQQAGVSLISPVEGSEHNTTIAE